MREKDYYGAIKGFCLKWNIPEVWNSDRITGANLIYEVIKVINAMILEQKEVKEMVEDFILMFNEDLNDTVKNILIDWKDSGILDNIINDALFNQKLDKDVFDEHILINKDIGYNVLLSNVKQNDSVQTNSTIINNLIQTMDEGTTLIFPKGTYYFNSPLLLDRRINLKAIDSSVNFIFKDCDGLIITHEGIQLENITLSCDGYNPTVVNPKLKQLGRIGIKIIRDEPGYFGRLLTTNIHIKSFNTGLAMLPGIGSIWSGAYSELFNMIITYCEIGFFAIDTTHTKFYGGSIQRNTYHGIYVASSLSYSNVEFIGSTIENNGEPMVGINYEKYGAHIVGETKIRLTNAYLELQSFFVDDGAVLNLVSTHIHRTVNLFSKGGIINSLYSHGYCSSKSMFGKAYAGILNFFNFNKGTATPLSINSKKFTYKSSDSTNSYKSIGTKWQTFALTDVYAKDLEWVKATFRAKVVTGTLLPSDFIPQLNLGTGSSRDGVNKVLVLPNLETFDVLDGSLITFFFKPRTGGSYLKPNELINALSLSLIFGKKALTTELAIEISDLSVEVFAKTPVDIVEIME